MKWPMPRILLIVLCLLTSVAHAAGSQLLRVPPSDGRPALTGMVWYPCADDVGASAAGAAARNGARCPMRGDALPLVVISHGSASSFGAHYDTAEALAEHGFVVAAINHPGDTTNDESEIGSLSALLVDRPADMKRLIDFMLTGWHDAARLDPRRIGFFGFSRGALTGLIIAGGKPELSRMIVECENEPTWGVCQNPILPRRPLPRDARIRAMVLADPVFGAIFASGLAGMTIPVQLWASEYGGDGMSPSDVEAVARGLPEKPAYFVVPRAAHFAFIAPCDRASMEAVPRICNDGEGFDRIRFHQTFNARVVGFFEQTLRDSRPAATPGVGQPRAQNETSRT
ncbi:alpha/beta hydrolase family protein [Burkholderia pseudomallei]|uniref:alpha/beta hydrolase family protein n=1 Tax=Burkholderia pseudomallei TaxID=28450 RepID=UPI00016B0A8F|nr:hypothetical protein [Burkholderia pseudomallei]AJX42123.1 alpha/beta hydrolase family protein [Burkholderia pseudomallei]AJX68017.1 alpha/beta hydrolase family protein [Burkholderia pseudomallei MSHR840]KGC46580.1 alpha/beta hydrolase family protein [Burkholderia pseudomallei]KGS02752.1 alpha/beta hydrolase family protein [Burkholderia pseudomallei MSHR7504]KGS22023.1 alpha/beta hydrolase family protein [Burkholderia pseudomallei MSHR4378]